MKIVHLALLCALFMLSSCRHIMPSWTQKAPQVLRGAKESIFLVEVPDEDGTSVGNAFMVAPGVLMTAKHVCHGDIGQSLYLLKDKKLYDGYIAWKDKTADVCILESEADGESVTLLAEVDDYNYGYVAGYVAHGPGPIQAEIALRDVQIRNEQPLNDGEGRHLVLNGQFQHGDSGSPIFNEDGYAIGILTAVFGNKDDEVGNGIAAGVDSRTVYAVYQDYLKARREIVPDPLKLTPPSANHDLSGKDKKEPAGTSMSPKKNPTKPTANFNSSQHAPDVILTPPKMIKVPIQNDK